MSKTPESVKAARRARTAALRSGGGAAALPASPQLSPLAVSQTCANFGDATGEAEACASCRGRVTLKVYACAAFGTCTVGRPVANRGCCTADCPGYAAKVNS